MENYFREDHAARNCIKKYYLASFSRWKDNYFKNIGKRSMQELFFWLGELGWLHFCHRKGHNFQKTKISRKDRKASFLHTLLICTSKLRPQSIAKSRSFKFSIHILSPRVSNGSHFCSECSSFDIFSGFPEGDSNHTN